MPSASPLSSFGSPSVATQTQVTLPRALTIEGVARLKYELGAAQQAGGVVQVGGSGVEEADTIGLQLLVAARQSSAAAGVTWILSEPSPLLLERARQAGMEEALALSP